MAHSTDPRSLIPDGDEYVPPAQTEEPDESAEESLDADDDRDTAPAPTPDF
jgi:hypothetical protein